VSFHRIFLFSDSFTIFLATYSEYTQWDVSRFSDRVKNKRPRADAEPAEDLDLAKYFVNPKLGHFEMPCTILDLHGCIMLWYLPGIYPLHRVVSFS
jgi:hypothetical protein